MYCREQMKKTISSYISLAIVLFLLQGCSPSFDLYSEDPLERTNWSLDLSAHGRALPARKMLLGTWDKIDQNDIVLVAKYYLAKAYLITSTSYQHYREYYIQSEQDWNTEVDGDFEDAEAIYLKARSLFIDANSFDNASSTSYLLSKFYKDTKNKFAQCRALEESKRLHLLHKSVEFYRRVERTSHIRLQFP